MFLNIDGWQRVVKKVCDSTQYRGSGITNSKRIDQGR